MSEKIELVTSKFSPYGHRVEMVLIEKEIPYEKREVNLANRPDWFNNDSPLGKVPIIYTPDNNILFDSSAICEYLEEAYETNPLQSDDLEHKAWHRGWMEFSNGFLTAIFAIISAQNQKQFDLRIADLNAKMTIMEKYINFTPYFEGEDFYLVDIFFASALKPLEFIDKNFALEIFVKYKNVAAYAEHAISRNSLKKSLPENYHELFKSFLERKKSHLLTMNFSL